MRRGNTGGRTALPVVRGASERGEEMTNNDWKLHRLCVAYQQRMPAIRMFGHYGAICLYRSHGIKGRCMRHLCPVIGRLPLWGREPHEKVKLRDEAKK